MNCFLRSLKFGYLLYHMIQNGIIAMLSSQINYFDFVQDELVSRHLESHCSCYSWLTTIFYHLQATSQPFSSVIEALLQFFSIWYPLFSRVLSQNLEVRTSDYPITSKASLPIIWIVQSILFCFVCPSSYCHSLRWEQTVPVWVTLVSFWSVGIHAQAMRHSQLWILVVLFLIEVI